eukprot:1156872-Pelagomonas_calceolata.AAC.3
MGQIRVKACNLASIVLSMAKIGLKCPWPTPWVSTLLFNAEVPSWSFITNVHSQFSLGQGLLSFWHSTAGLTQMAPPGRLLTGAQVALLRPSCPPHPPLHAPVACSVQMAQYKGQPMCTCAPHRSPHALSSTSQAIS